MLRSVTTANLAVYSPFALDRRSATVRTASETPIHHAAPPWRHLRPRGANRSCKIIAHCASDLRDEATSSPSSTPSTPNRTRQI